jgi:dihydroorotase
MTVDLTLRNCKIWLNKQLVNYGITIDEGIITSISKDVNLSNSDETVNCKGNIVLPGLVDVHVHFREPGATNKEDWHTGSMAALYGGITYVMDMPNNIPPITTVKRLGEKRKIAEKKSLVNFGLYAGIGNENINQISEIGNHTNAFKIFLDQSAGELKIDDDSLKKSFVSISKTGKNISVHAEDRKIIEENLKKYKDRNDALSHALIRSPEAEISAIKKVVQLSKSSGAKLHILHVTTKEGLNVIYQAKKENVNISCETCPHYLFMTQKDLEEKGSLLKINPPLRTKDDQKALWEGILNGTIDIISTDHAPHTLEEKNQDIHNVPSGVPGIETSLSLMLNAVNKRMISFEKLVELMHDNSVKRFDLEKYGEIEKGNCANLTVIDLNKKWKIVGDDLRTKCKWSPYEGWEGNGTPIITIINGNVKFNQL